jgi:hypothetical protein
MKFLANANTTYLWKIEQKGLNQMGPVFAWILHVSLLSHFETFSGKMSQF